MFRVVIFFLALLPACASAYNCIRQVDVDAYARVCSHCHVTHQPYREVYGSLRECSACHGAKGPTWREHQRLVTAFGASAYVTGTCQ